MTKTILALVVSSLLFTSSPHLPRRFSAADFDHPAAAAPMWWGMIDPELSLQFARLPWDADSKTEEIIWDWSWRGLLEAIFGVRPAKEAQTDAASA